MKNLLKKGLVEFLGTFFIMFAICCSMFPNSGDGFEPLAIGFVYIGAIYAWYKISGANFNPAVSFANAINGDLKWTDFVLYAVVQILGAFLGALLSATIIAVPPFANEVSFNMLPMCVCEFIFTFAICFAYLGAEKDKKTLGLAVGAIAIAGFLATLGTCYGVFNPAIAVGFYALKITQTKLILTTILTNFVAGAAAAGVFKLVKNDTDKAA